MGGLEQRKGFLSLLMRFSFVSTEQQETTTNRHNHIYYAVITLYSWDPRDYLVQLPYFAN